MTLIQPRLAARVLFDEEGPDGRRLFASPTELSAAIASRPGATGSQRSRAAFLGQILNQGHRSCPESLIDEITAAVQARLENAQEEIREDWLRRVRQALRADNVARSSSEPLSAAALYEELLYLAETAAEQYIITNQPAERVSSERAAPLREILLRRLGLDPFPDSGARTSTVRPGAPRYTFSLSSAEAAVLWWQALLNEVRIRGKNSHVPFDLERAKAELRELDQLDYLRVFAVPRIACGCPVVVFDPDEASSSGFNLYYFFDGTQYLVSVAKMDSGYLQDWKSFVHAPLESGSTERRRVSFTL